MSLPFLPCFSSLFLLLVLIFHIPTSNGEPARFACNNTYNDITAANYTVNGTFQTNLKILLPSLSSNVSVTKGFYNTSIGEGSNKVYGLVLCRGDVPPDTCSNCTKFASADLLSRCQSKSSIIWYDLCQVQYSDFNFFDFSTTEWWFWVWNLNDMTDSEVEPFKNSRAQLMSDLANKTAYDPLRGMFATGNMSYSSTNNVFGLMQCKPVISGEACHNCLEVAITKIPECCDSKQGGRVVSEVCSLRFENESFFGESLVGGPAPPPTLPPSSPGRKKKSRIIVFLIPAIAVAIILFIIAVVLLRKKKIYSPMRNTDTSIMMGDLEGSDIFFRTDFETIRGATDDFSEENKLGEGGFGPVYKGSLPDGREIAVKRLSINSGQGAEEFRNEVASIAKLQHRNLVRLFGCCTEGEEMLLIYEYVPNRSLDYFLFDPTKRVILNWEQRYKIIGGIARGLLYIHEDSRLRVIHRDLKASNILLDADMIPKISDFGLAKRFGLDQTQGNTSRIAGTRGYMSPEYATHGQFSVKSDVFSFGVLLLEIISGQKNSTFYQSDHGWNLLSYVWRAWNDGTILEIIDSTLREHCSVTEAERCIHIGLLCVQKDAMARPIMSAVVLMLNSFPVTPLAPSAPAFFSESAMEPSFQIDHSSQASHSNPLPKKSSKVSQNDMSITEMEPR